MPATLETVQTITDAGISPVFINAGADGHLIPSNEARTFLHVKNAGLSPVTMTIAGGLVRGSTRYLEDRAVVIAAESETLIRLTKYDENADRQAEISFSTITDVSFAALL